MNRDKIHKTIPHNRDTIVVNFFFSLEDLGITSIKDPRTCRFTQFSDYINRLDILLHNKNKGKTDVKSNSTKR